MNEIYFGLILLFALLLSICVVWFELGRRNKNFQWRQWERNIWQYLSDKMDEASRENNPTVLFHIIEEDMPSFYEGHVKYRRMRGKNLKNYHVALSYIVHRWKMARENRFAEIEAPNLIK
jgi:biopolymer transport protein ExbB/TolQ